MASTSELQAMRKSAPANTKFSTSRNAKRKGNSGTPNYTNLMPRMTDAKLARHISGLQPGISQYALRLAIKRVNREMDSTGTADIRSIVSAINS